MIRGKNTNKNIIAIQVPRICLILEELITNNTKVKNISNWRFSENFNDKIKSVHGWVKTLNEELISA